MVPTPSWPRIRPLATAGTSPLRMCRSVPQMVVVSTLHDHVARALDRGIRDVGPGLLSGTAVDEGFHACSLVLRMTSGSTRRRRQGVSEASIPEYRDESRARSRGALRSREQKRGRAQGRARVRTRELAGDPAAHNVERTHVGCSDNAVHLDAGAFSLGIEPDKNFELWVPTMVVHEASELPDGSGLGGQPRRCTVCLHYAVVSCHFRLLPESARADFLPPIRGETSAAVGQAVLPRYAPRPRKNRRQVSSVAFRAMRA